MPVTSDVRTGCSERGICVEIINSHTCFACDRRGIEQRLFSGQLLAVTATNGMLLRHFGREQNCFS